MMFGSVRSFSSGSSLTCPIHTKLAVVLADVVAVTPSVGTARSHEMATNSRPFEVSGVRR